jgi:multidrug efflux pump subunit AcrB
VREDQQYVRFVSYDYRGPPRAAARVHKAFMASVRAPTGYTITDSGFGYGERDTSARGLWLVFAAGIVLVVLAVAIVFDSVWAAAMVLISLPIAFAGVMGAFWLAKAAFTREAAVGVVLVVGLAVNQVILVVDGALARRRHNMRRSGRAFVTVADSFHAALDRAGPVLLITLTTLASVIPMATNTKLTDLFGSIALATAGGTVAGTIGALYITPAVMAIGWGKLRWR